MLTNLGGFITAWYNLPFTVLLGVGALLAALQLIGLGGDPDTEPDLDGEADLEVAQDLATDQDLDTDSDADSEAEAEAHPTAPTLSLLAFLGVGKAPLMVVLLILFGTLGILGWSANALVAAVFGNYPALMLAVTGPAALLGAAFITSRLARWIGKALPPISTTASEAEALVGRLGVVISPYVDERYGQVHLRDSGGTLISIFAVGDHHEMLQRGDTIAIVSYQPGRKCYVVTRPKALR